MSNAILRSRRCGVRFFAAFVVGGLICMAGEGVHDAISALFPALPDEDVGSWTTVVMIFVGAFLTAIGVYDKIGRVAGGGSIIPITGFANSVVSPALEYNREGVFFGICREDVRYCGTHHRVRYRCGHPRRRVRAHRVRI